MKNGIENIHLKQSNIPFNKGKILLPVNFFHQYGNKVSMFETVKIVDEDTVTKENNFLLTR